MAHLKYDYFIFVVTSVEGANRKREFYKWIDCCMFEYECVCALKSIIMWNNDEAIAGLFEQQGVYMHNKLHSTLISIRENVT